MTAPELPMCAWVRTEGLDLSPIVCAAGDRLTQLVEDLSAARLISDAALVPCCRPDDTACTRDTWNEPGELDRPIEVLMRAAVALGIPWPADVGQLEPEYSVLPSDD